MPELKLKKPLSSHRWVLGYLMQEKLSEVLDTVRDGYRKRSAARTPHSAGKPRHF